MKALGLLLALAAVLVGQAHGRAIVDVTAGGDFTGAAPLAFGFQRPYAMAQGLGGRIFVAELDSGEVTELIGRGDHGAHPPHAFGLGLIDELVFADGRLLVVRELVGEIVDVTTGGDLTAAVGYASGFASFPQMTAVWRGRIAPQDAAPATLVERQP